MKQMYIKLLMMIGKAIFGKKWSGHKTMSIGVIETILGIWVVIDGTLFPTLCEYIPWFCTVSEASFYGTIIIIIGVLKQVLRTVTKGEMPTIIKLNELKTAA